MVQCELKIRFSAFIFASAMLSFFVGCFDTIKIDFDSVTVPDSLQPFSRACERVEMVCEFEMSKGSLSFEGFKFEAEEELRLRLEAEADLIEEGTKIKPVAFTLTAEPVRNDLTAGSWIQWLVHPAAKWFYAALAVISFVFVLGFCFWKQSKPRRSKPSRWSAVLFLFFGFATLCAWYYPETPGRLIVTDQQGHTVRVPRLDHQDSKVDLNRSLAQVFLESAFDLFLNDQRRAKLSQAIELNRASISDLKISLRSGGVLQIENFATITLGSDDTQEIRLRGGEVNLKEQAFVLPFDIKCNVAEIEAGDKEKPFTLKSNILVNLQPTFGSLNGKPHLSIVSYTEEKSDAKDSSVNNSVSFSGGSDDSPIRVMFGNDEIQLHPREQPTKASSQVELVVRSVFVEGTDNGSLLLRNLNTMLRSEAWDATGNVGGMAIRFALDPFSLSLLPDELEPSQSRIVKFDEAESILITDFEAWQENSGLSFSIQGFEFFVEEGSIKWSDLTGNFRARGIAKQLAFKIDNDIIFERDEVVNELHFDSNGISSVSKWFINTRLFADERRLKKQQEVTNAFLQTAIAEAQNIRSGAVPLTIKETALSDPMVKFTFEIDHNSGQTRCKIQTEKAQAILKGVFPRFGAVGERLGEVDPFTVTCELAPVSFDIVFDDKTARAENILVDLSLTGLNRIVMYRQNYRIVAAVTAFALLEFDKFEASGDLAFEISDKQMIVRCKKFGIKTRTLPILVDAYNFFHWKRDWRHADPIVLTWGIFVELFRTEIPNPFVQLEQVMNGISWIIGYPDDSSGVSD